MVSLRPYPTSISEGFCQSASQDVTALGAFGLTAEGLGLGFTTRNYVARDPVVRVVQRLLKVWETL